MTIRLAIVADDDDDARFLVAAALRRAGFGVSEATNGLELLAMMEERDCDGTLVVSDIRMPRCDGITVTHTVRARMPTVPIVLITANTDDETRKEALCAGADRVLYKPLDLTQLVASVVELANRTQ